MRAKLSEARIDLKELGAQGQNLPEFVPVETLPAQQCLDPVKRRREWASRRNRQFQWKRSAIGRQSHIPAACGR